MNGKHLSKDWEIFEITGLKISNWFNSLKTVFPTSIESERAEHN